MKSLLLTTAAWFTLSAAGMGAEEGEVPKFEFSTKLEKVALLNSPDGKLTLSYDQKTVQLLDAHSKQPVGPPLNADMKYRKAYCWTFSHDGRYLFVGMGYHREDKDNMGSIVVYDLRTKKQVERYERRFGAVRFLSISPDDRRIGYSAEKFSEDGK